MNWVTIGQDIISNSVSGIIVAAVCGGVGWFIYSTGIKGKDREQQASARKNDIYIPLKYELISLMNKKENIWEKINVFEIKRIVEKNDEFVVEDALFQKCDLLLDLINEYNLINPYAVASNILCTHFENKYKELYGTTTHPEVHYDSFSGEAIEYEATDYEIIDFSYVADSEKNIDTIFEYSQDMEEYCNDMGYVGPIEEYLAILFTSCLPKKDNTYKGVDFEKIEDVALKEKRITPAEYMAKNFRFMELFEQNKKIQDKEQLFYKIQELSFELYEDVVVKIRSIGKKYELE